jgi:hypothetical protein
MRMGSFGNLIVVYFGSPTGPGLEGQDPFWSTSVFRRGLVGHGTPVVSEINPPIFLRRILYR